LFLSACLLFGGGSRTDIQSLALLQPFAVICIAVFLFTPGAIELKAVKSPLLFLGTVALLMTAQLIPLPPALWTRLPGQGQYAAVAAAVGIEQPWRSISLAPDLTLASLVGLVTPIAVLIGFAAVSVEHRRQLLSLFIVAVAVSTLLGLAQLAGGPESPFYFYDITNRGLPVGLFSNRNHQALFLAMAWPMLAAWATLPAEPRFYSAKRWVVMSLGVFLIPMLLVTGSRAGLALGVLALMVAFVFWRRGTPPPGESPSRWSRLLMPTAVAAAIFVIAASIVLSRDSAVQRIMGMSFDQEGRIEYLPTILRIARDFFPVGAGFGGFDPLFRSYEPFDLLIPAYLNHAHNDLVELIISGGLPALAILLAFLGWLGRKAHVILRSGDGGRTALFAQLGLFVIASLLLASLVDYPLRTPLMEAFFAVACGWVSSYEGRDSGSQRLRAGENALPNGTSPIGSRVAASGPTRRTDKLKWIWR
jgi:O-antigen ligase